ncbi:MAG TPA: lytic transglycosylase domain-containing protein [Thermoanaerobaculia bacterium]|nr:lytic transglycosylase domain-containing protein [Thermoanaerobaculia bacterium]
MRKVILIIVAVSAGAVSVHASGRFVAGDVAGVGIKHKGKISIKNDEKSISAYAGDFRRALLSLKSSPVRGRSYGSILRNDSGPVSGVVPVYLRELIGEAGRAHRVDPRLVAAVVHRESAFNPNAVSHVGAQGLMQLMPATAKWLGVSNSFDARQNVFAGAKYLSMLLDTFDGDLDLTLAAYNAGPGAVQKYRGIPPYRETQKYVAAIRASYEKTVAGR